MSLRSDDNNRERNLEREYLVKAAMLVKILQQTTWPLAPASPPKQKNSSGSKRRVVCVAGANPFPRKAMEVFEAASKGPVEYQFLPGPNIKRKFCHMIFVSDDSKQDVDAMIRDLATTPTLLVSDIPGFAERGGDIEFFLQDNRRIKILINERSTAEKGFVFGPEMQSPNAVQFIQPHLHASQSSPPFAKGLGRQPKIVIQRSGPQTLH